MNISPRRKQNIKYSSNISPKSSYNSIYITSTKKSPYSENPIFPMLPPAPLAAAKKKSKTQPIVFPEQIQSKYDRSPRKFISTSNLTKGYKNQTELLNEIGKTYNENERYTFQQKRKLESLYQCNHSDEYKNSKMRTQQILNNRYYEEAYEQKRLNRQSKTAIKESYNHDIYYNDHMFSTHYKDLRIIPVANRCETFYHIRDQQST